MREEHGQSLSDLQRFVTDAVRSDRPSARDPNVARRAEELLVPSQRGLSPSERLEIYREQFWLRHVSNLTDDFPTLGWVLGSVGFNELTNAYLTAHPPRTWNLQRLGANLPDYVARETRWNGDPLAVDSCRLDWAFMEAFDAADAAPLDVGPLATATEEAVAGARLTFHPSIRCLALRYPIHDLREAVKRETTAQRPEPAATGIVVWREATFALRAIAIEPMAFDLLAELRAGISLGRACENVATPHATSDAADIGARVGEWFQQWTARGWVSAIALGAA